MSHRRRTEKKIVTKTSKPLAALLLGVADNRRSLPDSVQRLMISFLEPDEMALLFRVSKSAATQAERFLATLRELRGCLQLSDLRSTAAAKKILQHCRLLARVDACEPNTDDAYTSVAVEKFFVALVCRNSKTLRSLRCDSIYADIASCSKIASALSLCPALEYLDIALVSRSESPSDIDDSVSAAIVQRLCSGQLPKLAELSLHCKADATLRQILRSGARLAMLCSL